MPLSAELTRQRPMRRRQDASAPASAPGFSKEFMRAGIEAMSAIREWRSAE
jgi:hypothetical protein